MTTRACMPGCWQLDTRAPARTQTQQLAAIFATLGGIDPELDFQGGLPLM